jgi:hypothetical protein
MRLPRARFTVRRLMLVVASCDILSEPIRTGIAKWDTLSEPIQRAIEELFKAAQTP